MLLLLLLLVLFSLFVLLCFVYRNMVSYLSVCFSVLFVFFWVIVLLVVMFAICFYFAILQFYCIFCVSDFSFIIQFCLCFYVFLVSYYWLFPSFRHFSVFCFLGFVSFFLKKYNCVFVFLWYSVFLLLFALPLPGRG